MIISLKFTVKEKKMLAFLLNSTQLKQINHTYYLKKLPLERQLLLQSYKFEADYLASLAGDMLLEYGINKLYGITEIPLISLGEHGKPFFENSNIHFNISHSGKYTLCAIGNTPVGIDIQEINFFDEQQIMSIVNHFFSSSEKKLINESNCPVDLFFTRWCLKESYVKYTGTGLTVPLDSFSFSPKKDSPFVEFYSNGQNYSSPYFYTSSIDDNYKLAICSEDKSLSIKKLDIFDIL